MIGIKIK